MKNIFLTMAIMATMFFVSCDQNSASDELQGSNVTYQTSLNSQAKLASAALTEEGVNCTPISDNAVVYRTGTATGNYCAWTPTAKTIGPVSVQFEGIYGSGLRPTTPGWYVGVVNPSAECATNGWSAIAAAIDVKNLNAFTIGAAPSCSSVIIPENVVGAIGTAYGYNFGLGYYDYDSTNRLITISKKVVIWKDAVETDPIEPTNPVAATEAYLVEITSIVPTHGSSVFGTVSYTYTKVL